MAIVNQSQFLSFLKNCNIDLTSFKDLSFDGICEEKSLQHFLSWICSSFDRDNICNSSSSLDIDDDIAKKAQYGFESIGDSYEDLFYDIADSLTLKLKDSERLKKKFILLDDKLRLKEKSVHDELVKAEKDLATAVSDCKNKQLDEEIEMVYKLILNTNPYVPNIESYNQKADNLRKNIQDLYNSSVDVIENQFKEELESFEPPVTNFENIAFEFQVLDNVSERQLKATQQWLNNIKTPVDFQYLLSYFNGNIPEHQIKSDEMNQIVHDSKRVTQGIAEEREIAINKRKHSVNLYLKNRLIENNKLLEQSLMYSLLAQSFINVRLNKIEELNGLVNDFFHSISSKCKSINDIVNSCKTNSSFSEIPLESSVSTVNTEVIGICQELLESLKNEYNKNNAFRETVGKALQYFRNGPTLRFCFLPMDLIAQFDNCRNLHEKVVKHLRQNAGYYCNVKSNVRGDHDRTQQLMWVFFLTDPSKLASIQLDYSSFNITFRN